MKKASGEKEAAKEDANKAADSQIGCRSQVGDVVEEDVPRPARMRAATCNTCRTVRRDSFPPSPGCLRSAGEEVFCA